MKKIIAITMSVFIFLGIYGALPIQAQELYLDVYETSHAVWLDTNSQEHSLSEGVPYASKIKTTLQVRNLGGSFSALLRLKEKEGLSFYGYYAGVLKINGRVASNSEYAGLIGGGLNITLSSTVLTFELEMQSIGSNKGWIGYDTDVSSNAVTSGVKQETIEHIFNGNFASQTNHLIRFFDGNTLLSEKEVMDGNYVVIPSVSPPIGYDFKGFNTSADARGSYLNNLQIFSSKDYYAIYQIKQFMVTYYVNGELYATRTVTYGMNAENIKVEDKKFMKWNASLRNITQDRKVYAIMADNDSADKGIKVVKLHSKEGGIGRETLKNMLIKFQKEQVSKNEEKAEVSVVYKEASNNKGINYFIIVLGSGIFMVSIYSVYKKKKKMNLKE